MWYAVVVSYMVSEVSNNDIPSRFYTNLITIADINFNGDTRETG